MLEKILIFFVFLGPLIFFHELGHFLFARLFGVRVEVFSIGFGPKIFSFKRGDTQYALSLIPLGGYVKMFGDDPTSDKVLTPEEAAVAYTTKGKWARFCIIFGGPLANFILAFLIYFALILGGEKVPQTKFGILKANQFLHKQGIRTGDVLKKINAQEITSFDDLNFIDSDVENITVNRHGVEKEIALSLTGLKFIDEFSKTNSALRAPILTTANGVNFLVKIPGDRVFSLEEVLNYSGHKIELYQLKSKVQIEFHGDDFKTSGLAKTIITKKNTWKETVLELGYYPLDIHVKSILLASAAEQAQIKSGDIIIGVGGSPIFSFFELKEKIQALKVEKPIVLRILDVNGERELTLTPRFKEYNGKKYLSVGVESGGSFYSYMVETQSRGFFDSIVKSYHRTLQGTIKTFLGFKKLLTGEVSLNNVGGPIAIGKVASDSFNISLSMFFRLMAIISINLGVINLFPIPVLDGGHIVFIILEALNKGPLSTKKIMNAQKVGMSLLFLLIFVALYNDISRLF